MYHQVFIRRINESTNVQQLMAEYHAVQGIIDRETYSSDADHQDLLAKLEIISSRIQVLKDVTDRYQEDTSRQVLDDSSCDNCDENQEIRHQYFS